MKTELLHEEDDGTMVAKLKALQHTWKWRSFVSYFLLFSGVVLIVSGVVLYIAPSGRVARSMDWRLLWMDKGAWESVHTNSGYVSILFGLVHLFLNWKVLVHYLWNRVQHAYQLKSEVVVALVLTVGVLFGSAWNWPVFSDVMDLGETFSNAWEDDNSTLPAVGEHTITAPDETASEAEVVETEVPNASEAEHEEGAGGPPSNAGWGRFTVAEMCTQNNVTLEDGLAHLAAYGIQAGEDDRIRTLADESGYSPADVVDIVLGQEIGTTEAAE